MRTPARADSAQTFSKPGRSFWPWGLATLTLILGFVGLIVSLAGPFSKSARVELPDGLIYTDLVEGIGATPQPGQLLTTHYVGKFPDGTKLDSSLDHSQPYIFRIGVGQVIKGWDEGLMTMKVGGKRELIIPSELAYGRVGVPTKIPPDATLIFEVELLNIQEYR